MEFDSVISTQPQSREAAEELCRSINISRVDLAVLFSSHHHAVDFETVLEVIGDRLSPGCLIGCTGESIIGPDCEIEQRPAMALWCTNLPGVIAEPFHLSQQDIQNPAKFQDWVRSLGVRSEDSPVFILLPEPYTFDAEYFLNQLDRSYPNAVVAGGIASGAFEPGQNRLFLNGQLLSHGLVGVMLSGNIQADTIVSQGCRPIGKPAVVTRVEQNVIYELGGQSAMEVLHEVYAQCSPTDQSLIHHGLHVGYVVDEMLEDFGAGDFLIRNIIGVTQDGGLVVTDMIFPGQTVQFHVRDSHSATGELESLLESVISGNQNRPCGGLMFNCNGRGTRMFDSPHHDVRIFNSKIADCPLAGFFAQGEIGRVGGRTFLHGFTSSVILFRGKDYPHTGEGS